MEFKNLNTTEAYQLSVLLEVMAERGITKKELFQNINFSEEEFSKQKNQNALLQTLLCISALELSGDPELGLELGSRIDLSKQGVFGYALITSATLEDTLRLMVRYNQALMPSVRVELVRSDQGLSVLVTGPQISTALERFYSELLYTCIVSCGAMLTGDEPMEYRLELEGPPPANLEHYREIFGANIHFQASRSAFTLSKESLALPISNANPTAMEIYRRECDRLLEGEGYAGNLCERVKQILIESGSDFPNAAQVADRLHISESTLQRRLHREGMRFQQLLDQVRHKLANEYLFNTNLPVADVACLTGFSDAANFRRSYRRWTGTTPSAARLDPENMLSKTYDQ